MKNELISLFSGAGGLDVGFRNSGFETVVAMDNCPSAVKTFNCNIGREVARQVDLAVITPEEFLDLIPASANPVGLIGGPPCQGFSRGNSNPDPSDPRNLLPFQFANLLSSANKKYNLSFFVFENVVGLTGPRHADRFEKIQENLRSAGFNLFTERLNASDFSVAQRRRRLFIVGINSRMFPAMKYEFPSGGYTQRVVVDIIGGLPLPAYYDKSLTPDTIPYHPNHWTMVPRSDKFKSVGASVGRSFKRLEWREVSPTVAYGHREMHVHPDGNRRVSVLESMLLQGFTSEYVLKGTLSSQITQISNAVPPPVAAAIAASLKERLGHTS